jgi:DNA-binding transcriptional MerR regulator
MRVIPTVKNAFSVAQLASITGLSTDMVHYLTSNGYLLPAYREEHGKIRGGKRRARGSVKFYSYRDLLIARSIYKLSEAGVQLTKIKAALRNLSQDEHWVDAIKCGSQDRIIHWLVTDGVNVYLRDDVGYISLMKKGGQRSFAFVLEMRKVQADVRRQIRSECRNKLRHFRLSNEDPITEDKSTPSTRRAVKS